MTERGPFSHRLRVRYCECDPQGVVFNGNYFTYFDVAMTEFHRQVIGEYADLVNAGLEMVVAEASARYLAPAHFDEELDIELAPGRLGTSSGKTIPPCASRRSVAGSPHRLNHSIARRYGDGIARPVRSKFSMMRSNISSGSFTIVPPTLCL